MSVVKSVVRSVVQSVVQPINSRRGGGSKYFIITIDTTKAGSASDTMVIPTRDSGYDCTVEWGDGVITTYSGTAPTISHTYDTGGVYQIKISGDFPRIYFNNIGDKLKLISIDNWGVVEWGSFENSFYGCANMDCSAKDSPKTTLVTTFANCFSGCSTLTSINLHGSDVSSVISFNRIFYNCTSLSFINVSGWDVSSVNDFHSAFRNTKLITLDVSNWDTSSATIFSRMFMGCSSLTTIDVSGWNTSLVEALDNTFNTCSSLTYLDVSNWDTSSVTTLLGTFSTCSSLTSLDVSNWDTSSATSLSNTFNTCSSLTVLDVSNWDTSSVTTLEKAFNLCSSLTYLDVSNWDTSLVENFNNTFNLCSNLKGDFSGLEIAACTDITNMFYSCQINNMPLSSNYDALLISFAGQVVNSGLNFNGILSEYDEGLVNSGTTDGTTADKLIDSSKSFTTTVTIGDVIYNTTDGTYARVTDIDNDTTLSIDSDIMVSGENYHIQHSNAAKARASLILDDGWTVTDGGPVNLVTFDKAKFIFTTDDGADNNYDYMYPLYEEKGIKGTFYVPSNYFDGATRISWDEAIEMNNDGHIIGSHGSAHTNLTEMNEAELNSEFTAIDTAFINNGLPAPDHLAYPFGAQNELVRTVAADYYSTGRETTNNYLYLDTSLFRFPATIRLDTTLNDYDNIIAIKEEIDRIIEAKTLCVFDGHGALPDNQMTSETPSVIQLSYLEEIIDYIQSKDVDIITIEQIYTLLTT